MKSHRNLHPQVCSVPKLLAAARSAMRGKLSGTAAAGFHACPQTIALIRQILATHADFVRRERGDGHPCGLPIGNLTSQFFANIYLDGFNHIVKQRLRVKGYVRYVDDFLLVADSKQQARAWGNACRDYLRDRAGADFCGFVCYRSGRVKMRGASVRSWIGHVSHADTWRLRAAILSARKRQRPSA